MESDFDTFKICICICIHCIANSGFIAQAAGEIGQLY